MPKYLLASSEIVDKVMPEGDMWGDFVNGPVYSGDSGDSGDENDSPLDPEDISDECGSDDYETGLEMSRNQFGDGGRYL